jgi:hypothetical protein
MLILRLYGAKLVAPPPLFVLPLAPAYLAAYACGMREVAKWVAVLFIAVVALSPIFEVFDKADGWAQDGSDVVRYIVCLLCFLVFSLRRTVFTFTLISFVKRIFNPIEPHRIERKPIGLSFRPVKSDSLFLTFHDLRI